MTFLTTTSLNDVSGFEVPAVPYRQLRRAAMTAAVIVAASGVTVGALTAMAAAWMIGASLLASPHEIAPRQIVLHTPADLAPARRVANPYGELPRALSWLRGPQAAFEGTTPVVRQPRPAPAAPMPAAPMPAAPMPVPRPQATTPSEVPPARRVTPDFSKVVPTIPPPPIRPSDLNPAPESMPRQAMAPEAAPLPPRHPVESAPSRAEPARRQEPKATAVPVAPVAAPAEPAVQDRRNPLERLFDALTHSSGATASREETGPFPQGAIGLPAPGSRTAVYDIAAHTVYLPDGQRLEAHSGLGPMLDDPRSQRAKDRGVTPAHVYNLSLRERLFHGVAALRLTPVGAGAMFGRVGLLAHTYMLGPNGQSNGCVSFRNYPKFLQAFRSGEITRMVVVAHLGDAAPGTSGRRWRYASN